MKVKACELVLSAIAFTVISSGSAGLADDTDGAPEDCSSQNAIAREIVYVCEDSDLVDANYFLTTEQDQIDKASRPADAGASTENDQTPGIRLSSAPRPNTGTAYIAKQWLWKHGQNGAIWDGEHLKVPVCWLNPRNNALEKEARNLVRTAVNETWHANSHIRFTGWTKCVASETGGVRIKIADVGPKAYVGRIAGERPISMWLNFTFRNWSTTCARQDPRPDNIHWEYCVYSIAVHEFGHVLGFYHEHDRLFHGVDFHGLNNTELAQRVAECAKRKQTTPTTSKLSKDAVATVYDPKSIMNYCFEIYDHRAGLTNLDIKGLKEAYPKPS